jgi:hypothetical protein
VQPAGGCHELKVALAAHGVSKVGLAQPCRGGGRRAQGGHGEGAEGIGGDSKLARLEYCTADEEGTSLWGGLSACRVTALPTHSGARSPSTRAALRAAPLALLPPGDASHRRQSAWREPQTHLQGTPGQGKEGP